MLGGGDESLLYSPITWAVALSTGFYLIYRNGTKTFSYFSDQGIPGPKPLPYIGNLWGLWKANVPQYDRDLVKKYGRVVGYFDGTYPNLYTTDAELIRSIFLKDFDHFINRRPFEVRAKFFRKVLLFIRDQQWKDVRSAVTPAFTTGKIKQMSVMIQECARRLTDKFRSLAETEGKIDAKKQFSAFTIDVIARCAFGLQIDDLEKTDNPFMKNAQAVFNPPVNKTPIIILPFIFPIILKLFGDKIFTSDSFQFFVKILQDLMTDRSKSSDRYNDFVEVATEAISDHKKEVDGKSVPMWTKEEVDELVISQSTLFLLAGFHTTANTLTNSVFVLAKHPDMQDRLYQEISKKIESFGEVNHDMVLDFPYLDQVIHEVLRMYPPGVRVERECNKDVTYNGIHIKKGTIVTVPIFALHYDEDYYPDPEKFDPDRWSPENKANMNPYVWMPFGMGPRNCVGMRFALEEIKIALATLVHKFRFFPVPETPEKMEYEDGFLSVTQPVRATVGIEVRF